MAREEIVKQASKRLAVAAELLAQVWAIQSYNGQNLVEDDQARDEIIKLIDEFIKESKTVNGLVDEFLRDLETDRSQDLQ